MFSLLTLFAFADDADQPDDPPFIDISPEQVDGELTPPSEEEPGDTESDLMPPTWTYAISDGSSQLYVVLLAPQGSKAHDHVVQATFVTGEVVWGLESSITVEFPVNGLTPDTDELRAVAGFDDTVKEKHQAKVKEHVLAENQLNEATFGNITFVSTEITPERVTGDLTIRGVTQSVGCALDVEADEETWTGACQFGITSTQFGFEPYAFGKYFNDEAMTVHVNLAAAAK